MSIKYTCGFCGQRHLMNSVCPHRKNKPATIEQATSRQLEIEQVKRAIARCDRNITLMETALAAMRHAQIRRHIEVARQEALAKTTNEPKD